MGQTLIDLAQLELGISGYMIKANCSGVPSWVAQNTINLSGFNNDLNLGLTIGTSAITGGTNTRILYNNSGVLGEYSVTGSGTTAVLSTSPTFTTSIITPNITGVNGNLTLTNAVQSSGAITQYTFTTVANTGQTASTNIPNFRVSGSTKTWAAGALTNQYWNYFTANTAAFASASTITNSYGLYVEAATAGANATITNNYAAGFNGKVEVSQSSNTITGFYMRNTSAGSGAYAVMNFTNNSVTTDGAAWVGLSGGAVGGTIGASTLLMYRQGKIQLFTDANSPVEFVTNGTLQWSISGVGVLTAADAKDISFGTGTGTKIGTATSQKIGFWNTTPIVQPTTAVAAATYSAVGGTTVQTNDTFDGYTVGQVVKALRNAGLLA